MFDTKNLNFLNHKFGKGQYAFYPIKLSRFAKKNEVCQKNHNINFFRQNNEHWAPERYLLNFSCFPYFSLAIVKKG